ncbi:hypothetical protein [Peribacillus kribbensis]|uniref:hypothetical protein n=1 Tax=Peribacillus kribbensis TaxID=356658 RepID=UPI000412EC4D|nr:hypothetical protein [Peribacillus kribbensis]
MKRTLIFVFLAAAVLLVGWIGFSSKSDSVQWFETEQQAINYGVKEEDIQSDDILGKPKVNGETFVIYKFRSDGDLGVGTANLVKKNHKYSWQPTKPKVIVKTKGGRATAASTTLESVSGKKFTFYAGIANESPNYGNLTFDPIVDSASHIYYFLEPSNF